MSHRTRLIYRIPSLKEGIARNFDISGRLKDDFAVVSVPKKHDSVQAKDYDPLKKGDRAFVLASAKINKTMATVGNRMRLQVKKEQRQSQLARKNSSITL
jgi:hypothetical protein